MLSYAYRILNEQGYKRVATEEFQNIADMCSAILIKGITVQLKRGLGREYIKVSETIPSVRGKIDLSETIKSQSILKKQIECIYDDFSINSYMNRILKTTMSLLLKSDISKARKKELKKILIFFNEVELLDYNLINWNLQYSKNNQTYRMLMGICYLVIKGLIQTDSHGSTKLMNFIEEKYMNRLYERFILEYYRKEHPELNANPSQISWKLDDDMSSMLPIMQTDIMLTKDNKTLIIDAKYYSKTTQAQYDVHKIHSGNLYQIFTYVKNKELEMSNETKLVSGMLLYAKTDEKVLPNYTYSMSGNKIIVQTLDLDCDFSKIAWQLDAIADEHLGAQRVNVS